MPQFSKPRNPRFDGFLLDNIIQFNPNLRHFRLIKIVNTNRATIYDGPIIEDLDTRVAKDAALNDPLWLNYVVAYKRYDRNAPQKPSPPNADYNLTTP